MASDSYFEALRAYRGQVRSYICLNVPHSDGSVLNASSARRVNRAVRQRLITLTDLEWHVAKDVGAAGVAIHFIRDWPEGHQSHDLE